MPLTLEYEPTAKRPTKRRKLQEASSMARRANVEDDKPCCHDSEDHTDAEAGCESPKDHGRSRTPPQPEIHISDRDQLIECIKRGQRPTWVPKPSLQALYAEEEVLQERRDAKNEVEPLVSPMTTSFQFEHDLLFGPWTGTSEPSEQAYSYFPGATSGEEGIDQISGLSRPKQGTSLLINRSRHTPNNTTLSWPESPAQPHIGEALSDAWPHQTLTPLRPARSRAPSLTSSLVMRVPTSPLVNALNNPNLDFSSRSVSSDISQLDKTSRRRTLLPSSFQSLSPLSTESTPNFSRPLPPPSLRRDSTSSSQTHQPRRSIGSFTFQSAASLQTPKSHGRRCSYAPDASPMRRTSMVGSFEESLVRGRMSSPASKPFDFVAQIGVMGKGDCPANLKCPPHVSVPFQAVFYSYPSSHHLRSIADDTPSPYVGTIDIEHNLKAVQLATKQRHSLVPQLETDKEMLYSSLSPRSPENTVIGKALAREAQLQKDELSRRRSSTSSGPRVNLGGAYRIPQQGQLQIIIKNSNNIAVKLFLVPYDLQGMEPGTKTFIRQRSYSSGPIAEGALSEKPQRPESLDPLKDKSILRYLIHIKFCCPSKGKFYLYDNVRVVFANRTPDGKEKLRNEVQVPEPRFSPWKPSTTHSRSASIVTDFAAISEPPRQPSSPSIFDDFPGINSQPLQDSPEYYLPLSQPTEFKLPLHGADGFKRPGSLVPNSSSVSRDPVGLVDTLRKDDSAQQPEQAISTVQGFLASTSPRSSPVPWGSGSSSTSRAFSPVPVEAGAGLLSRQLREFNQRSFSAASTAESTPDPWAASNSLSKILARDSDGTLGKESDR